MSASMIYYSYIKHCLYIKADLKGEFIVPFRIEKIIKFMLLSLFLTGCWKSGSASVNDSEQQDIKDSDSDPFTQTDSNYIPIDTNTDSDSYLNPESDEETDSNTDSETEVSTDSDTDSGNEISTDSGTDSGSEISTDSGTNSGSEISTDSGTDSETETDSDTTPKVCAVEVTYLSTGKNGVSEFNLKAVGGTASNNLYAAGDYLFHFDGTEWEFTGKPDLLIKKLSAAKDNNLFIAGTQNGLFLMDPEKNMIMDPIINDVHVRELSSSDTSTIAAIQKDHDTRLIWIDNNGSPFKSVDLTGVNLVTDIFYIDNQNLILTAYSGIWHFKDNKTVKLSYGHYSAVNGLNENDFYAAAYWKDDYGYGTNLKFYYFDSPDNPELVGINESVDRVITRIIKLWMSPDRKLYFLAKTATSSIFATFDNPNTVKILWEGDAAFTDMLALSDENIFATATIDKKAAILHYLCK